MTKPTWTKKSYNEPPEAEVILCGMQDIISTSPPIISKNENNGEWDIFYR